MKQIELTQGQIALIDDEDFDLVSQYKWYTDKTKKTIYARAHNRKKNNGNQEKVKMHRLILNPPDGLHTDHINGNGLDNRRSNLRACTKAQNAQNQRHKTGGSSKYKGVCWHKLTKKWHASIGIDGKIKYLGLFIDEKEAAKAYNNAADANFGEFARLNSL